MEKLIRRDEAPKGEYSKRNNPVSVGSLDRLLEKAINSYGKYKTPYKLRKNIIYSLGFVEFQFRCLQDFKLNIALEKQLYKSIVITGIGIVEGILRYLLVTKGLHDTVKRKHKKTTTRNKEVGSQIIIVKRQIYEKMARPQIVRMNFSDMVKMAEKHKILGPGEKLYQKIKSLKSLRDRVHPEANTPRSKQGKHFDPFTDTDFNAFGTQELKNMAWILSEVFCGPTFKPSIVERKHFDYLKNYLT